MTSALSYKKSYRCGQSLQQFYTGGPITVSSDGSFLVCACDETIKLVDSSDASVKATLEGDTEAITALALSPDDKILYSSSHSKQIRAWDLSTNKCIRSFKGHEGPVMAMACDASGGLLATAGSDRKVQVWDIGGGFCTHYFKGHKDVVTCVMFHPDPNRLLLFSGSNDGTVRAWDLNSKKIIATMEKHFSAVSSLAISESGDFMLSAGRDRVVNLWDLKDYGCKVTIPAYEVLEAVCIVRPGTRFYSCISTQEQKDKKDSSSAIYFVTVGERGIIRIWNTKGAVCLFEQKTSDVAFSSDNEDLKRGFTSAFMLPSDQGLLCVSADQQFLFYTPEEDLKLNLSKRFIGYNEEIVDMKFLGDDEKFLAVATNLEQIRVYDMASMSCSYVLAGHTDIILCLDTCTTSSGSALIVTGSKDNSVRLWSSERRQCIGVALGHMGAVGAVAFSKKRGDFVVSGSGDRTIKVWSLDGVGDNAVEPAKLKVRAVVAAHDKDINALAVAPNDSYVCSGSQDRTACIWKLPDLVHAVTLKGHKRGIWSVEFSPVDLCVLTASGDKTIKMWAIADGSCLKTFEGHTSSVLRASFITRGTQFVSSGSDGLLKLWTVKTNECIATYDEHEDKVWALTVGKKTEMLATGGGDAVINTWHDSTAAEKEEAFRKEEQEVLKGQELENALVDADYAKAIQIAFELRRPHKLFQLLSELCRKNEAKNHLRTALKTLGKEELCLLFEYIREWNTKPKFCHVAQSVLFQAFTMLSPKEIVEIKGVGELLEGLIPYSQRHFSRIDRLERSTFLLDYALIGMSVLEPETETPQETNSQVKMLLGSEDAGEPVMVENENMVEEATTEQQTPEKHSKKKSKSKESGKVSRKKETNLPEDAGEPVMVENENVVEEATTEQQTPEKHSKKKSKSKESGKVSRKKETNLQVKMLLGSEDAGEPVMVENENMVEEANTEQQTPEKHSMKKRKSIESGKVSRKKGKKAIGVEASAISRKKGKKAIGVN